MTKTDRLTITPELVERFAAYYERYRAWGSLHAVLDDGNVQTAHVEHAVGWARDTGDEEGEALARILLTLTRSQRARLGRRAELVRNQPCRVNTPHS